MRDPVVNLCSSGQDADRANTVADVLDFLCEAVSAVSAAEDRIAPLGSSSLNGLSTIMIACSSTLALIGSTSNS